MLIFLLHLVFNMGYKNEALKEYYNEWRESHLGYVIDSILNKRYKNSIWEPIFSYKEIKKEIRESVFDNDGRFKPGRILNVGKIFPSETVYIHDVTINSLTFLELPFREEVLKHSIERITEILKEHENSKFLVVTSRPYYSYSPKVKDDLLKLIEAHMNATGIPPLHLSELIHCSFETAVKTVAQDKGLDQELKKIENIVNKVQPEKIKRKGFNKDEILMSAKSAFNDLWLVGLRPKLSLEGIISPEELVDTLHALHSVFCPFITYGPLLYEVNRGLLKDDLRTILTENGVKIVMSALENYKPFKERIFTIPKDLPENVALKLLEVISDPYFKCFKAIKTLQKVLELYYSPKNSLDIVKINELISKFTEKYKNCMEHVGELDNLIGDERRLGRIVSILQIIGKICEIVSEDPSLSVGKSVLVGSVSNILNNRVVNETLIIQSVVKIRDILGVSPPPGLVFG